jgi:hypothetical protein
MRNVRCDIEDDKDVPQQHSPGTTTSKGMVGQRSWLFG